MRTLLITLSLTVSILSADNAAKIVALTSPENELPPQLELMIRSWGLNESEAKKMREVINQTKKRENELFAAHYRKNLTDSEMLEIIQFLENESVMKYNKLRDLSTVENFTLKMEYDKLKRDEFSELMKLQPKKN